jgi:hypothetical protein
LGRSPTTSHTIKPHLTGHYEKAQHNEHRES